MAEIFLVNFNSLLPNLLAYSPSSPQNIGLLSLSLPSSPRTSPLSRIRRRELGLPPPSSRAISLSLPSSLASLPPPATLVNFRGPRIPVTRGVVRFRLDGYYSELDKKLCMMGKSRSMYNAGNFEPSVVLKLNYPKWSSIYDSLITGSLESVVSDKDDGENYFDAIMVLAFSVKHSYGYTFVGEDRMSSFPNSVESGEIIGLSNLNDSNGGLCRLLGNRLERFELVYGSECGGGVNCNPLGGDRMLDMY